MFCYNFLRTKNILGYDKMLEAIKNWQPDYTNVGCAIKNGFIIMKYSQIKPVTFLQFYTISFSNAAKMECYLLQFKLYRMIFMSGRVFSQSDDAPSIEAVGECPYCCWNGCRMKLQKIRIYFTAGIYRDKLSSGVWIFIGLMSYSEEPIDSMPKYS